MPSTRTLICLLALSSACGASTKPPAQTPQSPALAEPAPKPAAPVHRRGQDKLIVEIGSAGGTLELDNGARLEIPKNALQETIEVTFANGTRTTAFSNKEFERPLGPILEIAPELPLAAPVRVSVPALRMPDGFSEQDLAIGVEVLGDQRAIEGGHGTQTRWDYQTATASAGRAVAELSQVPGFRVQFLVSKSE